ncbi:hypothetical protein HRbin11_02432 [bacterium HR11]|nr:hypothetical protein HRbin11_02432 [bacterium HR11]
MPRSRNPRPVHVHVLDSRVAVLTGGSAAALAEELLRRGRTGRRCAE